MKAKPRPTCRFHCRSCDAHFTSLEAFDAHRIGSPGSRECADPDTVKLKDRLALIVTTEDGFCEIADPAQPRSGVVLYGARRLQGLAQEAFRG